MLTCVFAGETCKVRFGRYPASGLTSIQLECFGGEHDGEPMATASVNMPGYCLGADEVPIKSYSENMGILEALIKAGIIEPIVCYGGAEKVIESGFVMIPVCRILRRE